MHPSIHPSIQLSTPRSSISISICLPFHHVVLYLLDRAVFEFGSKVSMMPFFQSFLQSINQYCYVCVCLSLCLSVRPSITLRSYQLSFCKHRSLSANRWICPSLYICVPVSFYLCIYLFVCLCLSISVIFLSVSICPLVHLCVCHSPNQ